MSDTEIIGHILNGETNRFTEIVDRYLFRVRAICASYVSGDCDDLVQQTFVDAYLYLPGLRRRDRIGPWLAQIARNNAKNHLRALQTRREREEQAPPPAPPATAFERLERAEILQLVRDAIRTLPPATREAMMLRYVEGLSVAGDGPVSSHSGGRLQEAPPIRPRAAQRTPARRPGGACARAA